MGRVNPDIVGYSELMVWTLQRLDAVYPDWIDLSNSDRLVNRQEYFEKIWKLIDTSALVAGTERLNLLR